MRDVGGVWSLGGRETLSSIRNGICVCVVVMVVVALMLAVGVGVLMVTVGVVVLVIVVRILRELCIGVVEVVGVWRIGAVERDCTGVIDIMVLGGVFMVEMVEGEELVVECVMRPVLWCVNRRRYFLCRFSLMSVEMNELSVGGCLFGMVIWADCFLLLERDFLGKMEGTNVVMEVVVEVVVVEIVNVVRAWFFACFRRGCLGDMMDMKVVKEIILICNV